MYKLLSTPLKALKEVVVFFTELLKDEDGKTGLYLTVLLIPSICLGVLLVLEHNENERLMEVNVKLTLEIRNHERKLPVLKDSLRKQVMTEYVDLVKSMNDLNSLIQDDNTYRSRKIKSKTAEVSEQIKNIEYE